MEKKGKLESEEQSRPWQTEISPGETTRNAPAPKGSEKKGKPIRGGGSGLGSGN